MSREQELLYLIIFNGFQLMINNALFFILDKKTYC